MKFPNTVKAVEELLKALCPNTTRWLQDFKTLPAVHVYGLSSPGSGLVWERTDKIQVDVYDVDLDLCEELANQCRDLLNGRPHETSHGLLDWVLVDLEPFMVPYPADDIVQFSFQLRVEVRAIP